MEKLKEKLKKYIKNIEDTPDYVSPERRLEIETEEFRNAYKPSVLISGPSYSAIPRFYQQPPEEPLARCLREEARALGLQKRSARLLQDQEIKRLWALLAGGDLFCGGEDMLLTYADFKKIGAEADEKFKPYFTATMFAKMQREPGQVAVVPFFNYVMRKMWFSQTRIELALHDASGQGYLRAHDLDNYILDLVPTLPALDGLDASFGNFYVCTASRKFLFFLDPLRTGRVKIIDILASTFLDDMLELREKNLPKEVQEKNWFSAASALRVYGRYLNLDRDRNGMLSLDELQEYGSGTLTRVFLSRVFQQCVTYEGEIDYKTYLDLVLALENRREPQSLHYLFRVLDIHGKGYLDGFTLNFFFKAIQEQMVLLGTQPVSFEDVKDEIFDMVRPADPARITLGDLLASGHGGTAISILIEFQCFLAYEHRETLVADTPELRF